jgi:hypothetical protein
LQADFSPGVTNEGIPSVEVEDVADVYDAEMMLQQVQVGFLSIYVDFAIPPITYSWTVPLILDHSYLVGKST